MRTTMKTFLLAMAAAGLAFMAFPCIAGTTNSELPFFDDFDDYPEGTSLYDGTNGWYASSTNAIVQTNVVYPINSTKAAQIPYYCTLTNRFEDIGTTNVWIQMDLRPELYDGDNVPAVDTNDTALFYVDSNGYFVVHDGPPTPSTNWCIITNTVKGVAITPVTEGDWVRIDLYQNYSNNTWTLFADYILITNNIRFVDTNATGFREIGIFNGATTSYLDNVKITATNPPDLGTNDNDWLSELRVSTTNLERSVLVGETAASTNYQVWKTNGYYSMIYTNTPSTNWLSVDPTGGTSTGNYHIITNTVVYNTSDLEARTTPYTATIRVDGKDSQFGFPATNSPQTIAMTLKVLQWPKLSVIPTNFSQQFQQGGNPTNLAFSIWNDSAVPRVPMDYEFSESVAWLSLSDYSGTSTGEHDEIGIMFADMSGSNYLTGTYSGTILVTARDAGEGYLPVGTVTYTAEVVVTVQILMPEPPAAIRASDGTYEDKVVVNWDASEAAVSYKLSRFTTFDVGYASMISEVTVTNYDDVSASPGIQYYYWVRPVNAYGVLGEMTSYDSGYRALSPPDGVFASDGTYTNKIKVTWSASECADSYEVYRAIEGGTATKVYHTAELEYHDVQVSDGVKYVYTVKAKNSRYTSSQNAGDTGYVFSKPTGVSASDGLYVDVVKVGWTAVDAATGYDIWRSTRNIASTASKIGDTTRTSYEDSAVTDGEVYYYWVRAKNSTATGGFSESDRGYSAGAETDLLVSELVFLPGTIGTGDHPSVVSFRLENNGTESMVSPDTKVSLEFYASGNETYGDGDEIEIGGMEKDITLDAGSNTVVKVEEVSELTMPGAAGDYYVFLKVEPTYPSTLVDDNPDDNVTMRDGAVHVSASGSMPYQAINDYDGDGISDLAVVCEGMWYIASVDGRVIGWAVQWGGSGFEPQYGDYNGDGVADLAVYGQGYWFVMTLEGTVIIWGDTWGTSGFKPVYGDFDGSEEVDLAVYSEGTGAWYIRQIGGELILGGVDWGDEGYEPVSGDYDGDGIWDMAIYQEATGAWYIRKVDGNLMVWGENWGGYGYEPVRGDYDGDGIWDMAVYSEGTGWWFIRTVAGDTIVYGQQWGGSGFEPVFGDYNGDGVSDMAVYHESSGTWYIRTTDGTVLLNNGLWGGPGFVPVGR